MSKFRAVKTLQKFASSHASIHGLFTLDRHLAACDDFMTNRTAAPAERSQTAA